MDEPSIAARCHALSGLFEAELLVELMLRYWAHPLASDADFRTQLLEAAVGVLEASMQGKALIEGIPSEQVNLVMAIWFAEWSSLTDSGVEHLEARKLWLTKVRRAIPSCFTDQDELI